jgi:hypothetical protein
MNVVNPNANERDGEGPDFERLLRQLDDDDSNFHGLVEFGQKGIGFLDDRAAQRLGQSLLLAMYHRRQFRLIKISAKYMSPNADRYSALLEFFATAPNRDVVLVLQRGNVGANEHILTAMKANPQPGNLVIIGLVLKMQTLHLALQGPRLLSLVECRMHRTKSPPPLPQQVLPNDTTTNRDDSSERGTCLRIVYNKDCFGILEAATKLKTNVTSLRLDFNDFPIVRFDSAAASLLSFVTAQPNGMELIFAFSGPIWAGGIAEVLMYLFPKKCPCVHSLVIHTRVALLVHPTGIPSLTEIVSDTALTRFEYRARNFYTNQRVNALSRTLEWEQQIAAITQRNSAIPVYLETTKFLKPRRTPPIDSSSIVVYANDGVDRPKHQFVLSHALSQAADHPIFFSHCYEYVRNHVGELFGQSGQMRSPTEDAFFVARNDDDGKQGAI